MKDGKRLTAWRAGGSTSDDDCCSTRLSCCTSSSASVSDPYVGLISNCDVRGDGDDKDVQDFSRGGGGGGCGCGCGSTWGCLRRDASTTEDGDAGRFLC